MGKGLEGARSACVAPERSAVPESPVAQRCPRIRLPFLLSQHHHRHRRAGMCGSVIPHIGLTLRLHQPQPRPVLSPREGRQHVAP